MASTSYLPPDIAAIGRHLFWLCAPALPQLSQLRIEIGWGDPEKGPDRTRTYAITDLPRAASFAAWINRRGCNVYVGATLKRADAPERGRTRAEHAVLATCIPIDIDARFAAVAAQVAALAQPQLLVLTGRTPETRAQLFIRIAPTADLTSWEQLHARVVRLSGGDENALGRYRLVRLAGTNSYPSPAKTLRGYAQERTSAHFMPAPEYVVADLLAAIPAAPVSPSTPALRQPIASGPVAIASRRRRTRPPVSAVDAALRMLPDHYAEQQRLWIKVGFALYDFDPRNVGLDLWRRFSERCSDTAKITEFATLWQGFGRPYNGHRITIDWLLHEARRPCPKGVGSGA